MKHDPSVKIGQCLNILVFYRASVCQMMHMTAGKLRWAELRSFSSRSVVEYAPLEWFVIELCVGSGRWLHTSHHCTDIPDSQLFSVSQCLDLCQEYALSLIYFDHFLISACADPLEKRPEIKNICDSGLFSHWCEDRANRVYHAAKVPRGTWQMQCILVKKAERGWGGPHPVGA